MITTFTIARFSAWAAVRMLGAEERGDQKRPMLAVFEGSRILEPCDLLAAAGVEAGEPVERVMRRFPEVLLRKRDPAVEVKAVEEMLERLHRASPRLLFSLDDRRVSCEIGDLVVAQRLAAELELPAGLAPDLRTSELAGYESSPGRVVPVEPNDRDRWVNRRSVRLLAHYRFAAPMIERLELLGLTNFSRLRRLSQRHLRAQWGEEGGRLWRFLREEPRDRLPLHRPPLRFTRARRFEIEVLEPHEWRPILQLLAGELSEDLDGRIATTLTVRLDEGSLTGPEEEARLLPRSDRPDLIERVAEKVLIARPDPIPFALLALTLGGIRDRTIAQGSLFDLRPELVAALRRIIRRWPGSMVRIAEIDRDAPLPEHRVRLEAMRPEDVAQR